MTDRHDEYLRQEIELHKRLAGVYTQKRYLPEFSRIFQRHWNERMVRIGGLVAMLAGGARAAAAEEQPAKSTSKAIGLNHVALRVTDVSRSVDFYKRHLGMRVIRQSERNSFMDCGDDNFVALFRGEQPGLDHYCYTIRDYSPDATAERLRAAGLSPRRQENRLYFDDPDGLTVQVSGRRDSWPG